jgi:hypothetical protein
MREYHKRRHRLEQDEIRTERWSHQAARMPAGGDMDEDRNGHHLDA